jgi:hypothetical protein
MWRGFGQLRYVLLRFYSIFWGPKLAFANINYTYKPDIYIVTITAAWLSFEETHKRIR